MAGREIQFRDQQNGSKPQCGEDRIDALNKTLALVRPVGMNDDAAAAWLAVAVEETAILDDEEFMETCKAARSECSYHGQIVPFMMRGKVARQKDLAEFSRKMNAISDPWGRKRTEKLEDKSEAQMLIEQTAKDLKA